ncbi:MAG TPA: glycosyltransferase [Anaerolineae bacterium]|nr:glycosyltransferase [Anaerolineae bacterium]
MRLCVITCTYNRAHLLPRVIRCFEEQDYEDRCMLIYDDGGQYNTTCGDKWTLFSTPCREPSLGAKRNASIIIAKNYFHDIDAILCCDDDDLFMPWHLSAAAKALEEADWSRPSVVLMPHVASDQWFFQPIRTGHNLDHTQERLFHPAWAMSLDAVESVGGYPDDKSGPEDQGLMKKMEAAGVTQADPVSDAFQPSYVYCWGNNNISGMLNKDDRDGVAAWASLEAKIEKTRLGEWSFPFDPHCPVIVPHIRPRPF